MNIRILPAALALSAFAFAASAQTGGSMSGPASTSGGGMMASHASQGCTSSQNHMAGGAMSGGAMAPGNSMSGNHMSGGAMSGGSMAGGAMAGGSTGNGHMAANGTGCQPAQKPNQ
jgi:hypothetical protein